MQRLGLLVLLVLGVCRTNLEAQSRILVVGDSWAQQSSGRWAGQFSANGFGGYSAVNTGIAGMTAAALNTPGLLDSQITNPLLANPSIDMVHLSIGGNDFLGNWKASDSPATAAAKFSAIQSNVQGIVNHILSVRPTVQVTISSYDYLNFVDNVNPFGNSQNQANFLIWNHMGLPTAGQLNRAMFGDAGGGMEDYKEAVSGGNSRVHYYSIQGFNQVAGGGWGGLYGLDFPTPTNRMANSGQDSIHLNSAGYDLWIDQGFNTVYNGMFTGPSVATNPDNGGTLNVGSVLVGHSGNTIATAQNTGPVGSRLDVTFGNASGEFGGGSGTQYAFVDQASGGDVLSQAYTYTPTERGFDSQSVTISTNAGNQSFAITGKGVAPVNEVWSTDAGLTRIGTTRTATVGIINIGDGNQSGLGTISNLQGTVSELTGAISGSGGSVNLPDLANQQFDYDFTPTARGVEIANVEVQFSNGHTAGTNGAQTFGIDISGQGVGPEFQLDGPVFDFGDVSLGNSASLNASVFNLSTDPNGGNFSLTNLTIHSVSILGPDAGNFSLSSFSPGAVLGQLDELPFAIDFHATGSAGLKNATLMFHTDQGAAFGGVGQSFSFSLAGNVLAAADAALAVASTDNGTFISLDTDGNGTIVGQSPQLARPLDVAHDSQNNRYVVDALLSRVVKFDAAGDASVFADNGDGLLFPTAIDIDEDGNLFIANYLTDQILRLDSLGNASLFADSSSGLESPFGLALDSLGNLYVAEVDSRRILVIDGEGNSTIFADATDGLVTPISLELDAAGNLYVADAILSKIFKFDALGNVTVFADGSDGLLFPTGLAFDAEGNLYVSNYLTDQIIKIDPFGNSSIFATGLDGIEGPFGLDFSFAQSFAPLALQLQAVPEMSSFGLFGVGLLLVALRRRKKPVDYLPGALDRSKSL